MKDRTFDFFEKLFFWILNNKALMGFIILLFTNGWSWNGKNTATANASEYRQAAQQYAEMFVNETNKCTGKGKSGANKPFVYRPAKRLLMQNKK